MKVDVNRYPLSVAYCGERARKRGRATLSADSAWGGRDHRQKLHYSWNKVDIWEWTGGPDRWGDLVVKKKIGQQVKLAMEGEPKVYDSHEKIGIGDQWGDWCNKASRVLHIETMKSVQRTPLHRCLGATPALVGREGPICTQEGEFKNLVICRPCGTLFTASLDNIRQPATHVLAGE